MPGSLKRGRGFALIELMTTVLLVGVLTVLAMYGVRKYVADSKTTEARNTLGAIGRAVAVAYNREHIGSDVLAPGATSVDVDTTVTGQGSKGKGATVTHNLGLCGDSVPVPASLASIQGQKYQPNNAAGSDYETPGWQCLNFGVDEPQYYQYQYLGGQSAGHPGVTLPHGGSPPGLKSTNDLWSVVARGDLDGNGVTSWFVLQGAIIDGEIMIAPAIQTVDEDE
jgi:type IV pilus assembly protein PilA